MALPSTRPRTVTGTVRLGCGDTVRYDHDDPEHRANLLDPRRPPVRCPVHGLVAGWPAVSGPAALMMSAEELAEHLAELARDRAWALD